MSFQFGKMPEPIRCGGVISSQKKQYLTKNGTALIIKCNYGYGARMPDTIREIKIYDSKLLTYVKREYIGTAVMKDRTVHDRGRNSYDITFNTNGGGECDMEGSGYGYGCGKNIMLLNTGMLGAYIQKIYNERQILPPEITIQGTIGAIHA